MMDREMYRRNSVNQKIWAKWHRIEAREAKYEARYLALQKKVED